MASTVPVRHAQERFNGKSDISPEGDLFVQHTSSMPCLADCGKHESVELLVFAIGVVIAFVYVFHRVLGAAQRLASASETVALKALQQTENTVGGRPIEMVRHELALKDRQLAIEERKAEIDIRIKEIGLEHESKRAAMELDVARETIRSRGLPSEFDPEV